uniref:RNA-directed DNA polymerase, eukaryota, reverse transcriptase zinc-binding domain protein n=1 Tax=Tanacetum cinerariifolium TaxID=118510 RepID=A0A6L2JTM2_TANCI|nr:RNA-directed DNA polymerase, eukaryota, reverse transcriptase zinc-binding domain protein [Tanacetum cinerariifolium]
MYILKTFKVDERIVWVGLYGLPLSAWTSNAFKKVAGIWGNPLFVDADQNESLANERWVPDYDIIDDNSKKDWASNNAYSDKDEHSIHMNDVEEDGDLKDNNIDEENINTQSDDEVKDTKSDHTNDLETIIKPA